MSILTALLILTAPSAAPTPAELAEAVDVFHCGFEAPADKNFDLWPDDWKRGVGRGFPRYVKAEIVEDSGPDASSRKRCLKIELDGGGAAIYSPPVLISPEYSYVLTGFLKTAGLEHDIAYYSIKFYDDDGNEIQSYRSANFRHQPNWTRVEIGPLAPATDSAVTAVVGLHLEPTEEADLTGSAMFDDVRISRFPRMLLKTNRQHNIYMLYDDLEVTCEVSGISIRNPQLSLDLLDVHGQRVARVDRRLTETPSVDALDGSPRFGGTISWSPPIPSVGFFRVRATLQGNADALLVREITVVVASDLPSPHAGEFGWSIPSGENPLPLKPLASLLQYAGVNWVKFPVWESEHDRALADRIATFVERLSINNIEMIAVLDQPPKALRPEFGAEDPLPVASVFVEPELWQPAVDPVMTRLSMKVQWWQLGSDDDTSFIGFAELQKRIREIKAHLDKFGQEIRLGIAWHWLHESPAGNDVPWQFLSYTEGSSFTNQELERHLSGKSGSRTWILLEPLNKRDYNLPTRIRDLVTRMLAARMNDADAVFIPDPFDEQHGLMNPDGTPGELFLPWQTTARLVAGKSFMGSIQLPNGSENYIFSRGDKTVMVAWNHRPTTETIFLGHDVRQIDVWGHTTKPKQVEHRHEYELGPTPIFITGLNRSIALWRMAFRFEEKPLASVFGHTQSTLFHFSNTFKQGVGGKFELHNDEMWEIPRKFELKLMSVGRYDGALEVVLDSNTRTGLQPVRIDFDVTADRNYRFSIYRTIQIGLGEIMIDLDTHLDADKNLIVTQTLINRTDEFVSFDCLLFAPNRRRQRIQVYNLGRGRNTQNFYLPRGDELIGEKLWIRAEEVGGQRMLNYHIAVEP